MTMAMAMGRREDDEDDEDDGDDDDNDDNDEEEFAFLHQSQ